MNSDDMDILKEVYEKESKRDINKSKELRSNVLCQVTAEYSKLLQLLKKDIGISAVFDVMSQVTASQLLMNCDTTDDALQNVQKFSDLTKNKLINLDKILINNG